MFHRNRAFAVQSPRGRRASYTGQKALRRYRQLILEPLEDRTLLAATRVQLGALLFSSENFSILGTQYSAVGMTQLGYAPTQGEAFVPLIEIDGSVSFNTAQSDPGFDVNGSLATAFTLEGQSVPLFQGAKTFDVADLIGPGVELEGDAITVAGASLALDEIRFNNPDTPDTSDSRLQLQGSLTLPDFVGLSLAVDGTNHVNVSPSGISLTGVNASITNSFTFAGVKFSAHDLTASYSVVGTDDVFAIWGTASVASTSDDTSFQATLGTSSAPGLKITNGDQVAINASITGSVTVASATLTASNLTIAYATQGANYSITGGPIAFSAGGLSLSADFSGEGLVVQDGTVRDFDLTVNGDVHIAGATVSASSLAFAYTAAKEEYALTGGSVTFTADGLTFSASLPAKGLVVKHNVLEDFDLTITGQANIAGLAFGAAGLAFKYTAGLDEYTLKGGPATFTAGNLSLSASFPHNGVKVRDGKLVDFDLEVSGDASLGGLNFDVKNLKVEYTASTSQQPSQVAITGGPATFSNTDGSISFSASFPDKGLVVKGGVVEDLDLDVSTTMTFAGLTIAVKDLKFHYHDAKPNSTYSLSGSVTVTVSGNSITGTLEPGPNSSYEYGLVVVGGDLEYLNATLKGDLDLFGLQLDFDNLNLAYDKANGVTSYLISGGVTVPELFDASVTFGTQAQPGLSIVNGDFSVNDFTISLSDVPLGGFTIQELVVSYGRDTTFSVTVSVLFPQGWAVGGIISFVDGKLDEISLGYSAATGEGIEIGDTGVFLNMMSATVQNIDQPGNLVVSGAIGADFGGKVTIADEQVTIFDIAGTFTIDKDGMTIVADVAVGAAYQSAPPITSNPSLPDGLYGNGIGKVSLDWATGVYQADFTLSMYDDIFQADISFVFESLGGREFAISVSAKADVKIPDHIPFIGGKKLAQIDFLFDYNSNQGSPSGFVAAWVEEDIIHKFDIGIEFEFQDKERKVRIIGTHDVDNLQNQPPVPPTNQIYTFTTLIPINSNPDGPGATAATVQADWGQQVVSYQLTVLGPNGQPVLTSQVPGLDTTGTTGTIHFVGSIQDPTVALPSGAYTLTITLVVSPGQSVGQPGVAATYHYFKPTATAPVIVQEPNHFGIATVTFQARVDSSLADQATVSLYAAPASNPTNGSLIPQTTVPFKAGASGSFVIPWTVSNLYPYPYVVYAKIDDGFNTPVFSAPSASFTPSIALTGVISAPRSNVPPLSGLQVFIDLNNNGIYDPDDLLATTDSQGTYGFLTAQAPQQHSYNVYVIIPDGFELDPSSQNPVSIDFLIAPGSTILQDFLVNQRTSITGTINLGQAPYTGLGGVGVGLDLNLNGVIDNLEPTTFTNASGYYTFYNLLVGTPYVVIASPPANYYAVTPTFQAITTGSDPYNVYQAESFGFLPFVTISGTVTGNQLTGAGLDPVSGPMVGVTITLSGGDGSIVATTVTDSEGAYTFTGLPQGSYTITQSPPSEGGWQQTSPVIAVTGFPSGVNQSYTTSAIPNSLAAADFNNDGYIDFAVSMSTEGTNQPVDIALSNGQGGFTYTQGAAYTAAGYVQLIIAADVRIAGTPDIVVISAGGVEVLENDGSGNFTDATTFWTGIPANTAPAAVTMGRLDNRYQSNAVAYLFAPLNMWPNYPYPGIVVLPPGGGNAILIPLPEFTFPSGNLAGYTSLVVADMNGDGFQDLVTSDVNNLYIAFGSGSGGFNVQAYPVFQSTQPDGGALAVADFNGDSLLDVAVTSSVSPYQILILEQGGAQNWMVQTALAPYNSLGLGYQVNLSLIAADFNGDSLPDLLFTPLNPNESLGDPGYAYIYINDPTVPGGFDVTNPVMVNAGIGNVALITPDLNNDGLPDIVFADGYSYNGTQGEVAYVLNTSVDNPLPIMINVGPGQQTFTNQNFTNIQTGLINGSVFGDANRNGTRQAGEAGWAGVTVYLDINNNGVYDPGIDYATVTIEGGYYAFRDLTNGVYTIRVVPGPTDALIGPAATGYTVAVDASTGSVSRSFGLAEALLAPVADIGVRAGSPVAAFATRTSASAGTILRYRLATGAPSGATVDPITGAFSWYPTLAQAGKSYSITILASDPFHPTLRDSRTFTVTIGAPTRPEAFVTAVIQTVLGERPTPAVLADLAARMEAGVSRRDIALAVYNSAEHLGRLVRNLYATYLHRDATPSEVDAWVLRLQRGANQIDLAAEILESRESRASHPTQASFITGLFQDVLGMSPTPRRVRAWMTRLRGRSSTSVALAFLTSRPAYSRLVTHEFEAYLGRAPLPAETRANVQRLRSRIETPTSLAIQLLASEEFYNHALKDAGLNVEPNTTMTSTTRPRGPVGKFAVRSVADSNHSPIRAIPAMHGRSAQPVAL